MNINQNHLLIAFLATLVGLLALLLAPGSAEAVGGRLGASDGLLGLLLIEGGAIAGAQVPKA